MEILASVSQSFAILQFVHSFVYDTYPFYGTVLDANKYFRNRLYSELWESTDEQTRKNALIQATRIIDSLKYIGTKVDESQELEFPRTVESIDQAQVPNSIVTATYEIAFKLIDGYDPDIEFNNINQSSQGFAGVRSTYNGTQLGHVIAGVPSALAFTLLKTYLADPNHMVLLKQS